MSQENPPSLRARSDYVSQIEVNVPREQTAIVAGKHTPADELFDAGEGPNLTEAVQQHWAVFLQENEQGEFTAKHSEPLELFSGRASPSSEAYSEGRTTRSVATDSLLPDKLLLLPYDIVNRLHRSHLTQLDELWALRTLQQKRQLNAQKWPVLKERLKQVRVQAAELSSRFSKMEESSSSFSRKQFGTRAKKLQRSNDVARDLALKCRTAQARANLLGRLAKQLTSSAFSQGDAVLAVTFDLNNPDFGHWNKHLSKSLRTSVLEEIPGVTTCCASWDVDNKKLVLYLRNPPSNFEAEVVPVRMDGSSRLVQIVEECIGLGQEQLEIVSVSTKWLDAAEIETPLDIKKLGIQFHGLEGTALMIDWVEPGRWADVFGLKMDDLIFLVDDCPTAEMSWPGISDNHSLALGLKLSVLREK